MKINKIILNVLLFPLLLSGCGVSKNNIKEPIDEEPAISLNASSVTIKENATYQLNVDFINTTQTSISWNSADQDIAEVKDGLITAKAKGTTLISAVANDLMATCVVTVTGYSLTLDNTVLSLYKGETTVIKPILEGVTGIVSFKIDDTNIASIDDNGNIKAINKGYTTIRANIEDLSATCLLIVNNASISLNKDNVDMLVSETINLTATVKGTDSKVIWQSENENIATIDDNGAVKAIGVGQTIIKAKIDDVEAICYINVTGHILKLKLDYDSAIYELNKNNNLPTFKATVDGQDCGDLVTINDSTDINAIIDDNKISSSIFGTHIITYTLKCDEDIISKTLNATFINNEKYYLSKQDIINGFTYDNFNTLLPLDETQTLVPISLLSNTAKKQIYQDADNFKELLIKNSGMGNHLLTSIGGNNLSESLKENYISLNIDLAIYSTNIKGLSIRMIGENIDDYQTIYSFDDTISNALTSATLTSVDNIYYLHLETIIQEDYLNDIAIYNKLDNDFYLGKINVQTTTNVREIKESEFSEGQSYEHVIKDFTTSNANNEINSSLIKVDTLENIIQERMNDEGDFSSNVIKISTDNEDYNHYLNMLNTNLLGNAKNEKIFIEFDAYVECDNSINLSLLGMDIDKKQAQVGGAITIDESQSITHCVFNFTLNENIAYLNLYSEDNLTLYIGNLYIRKYNPNNAIPTTEQLHEGYTYDFFNNVCQTLNGNDTFVNIYDLPYKERAKFRNNPNFTNTMLLLISNTTSYSHIFSDALDFYTSERIVNQTNMVFEETLTVDFYFYSEDLKEFYFISEGADDDSLNITLGHYSSYGYVVENGEGELIDEGNGFYHLRHSYVIPENNMNSFNIFSPGEFSCYLGKMTIKMS